jgi:peptidoglycan/LPS O-acetylase OafA/YrhL
MSGVLRTALDCIGSLSEPVFAVGCFVLLNRWVRSESAGKFTGRLIRPCAALGLISYSLYLTHLPVLRILEGICLAEETPGNIWLRIMVYVPVCVGFAYLFFQLIERRFLGQTVHAAPKSPPVPVPVLPVRSEPAMIP